MKHIFTQLWKTKVSELIAVRLQTRDCSDSTDAISTYKTFTDGRRGDS